MTFVHHIGRRKEKNGLMLTRVVTVMLYLPVYYFCRDYNSAVETHVRGLEYSDIVMWKYEGVNGYT